MPEVAERRGPEFRRFRMEDTVPLKDLCIHLNRCVTVVPGAVGERILARLEQERYDQAPVYDRESRRHWGLVETEYLRQLFTAGYPLQSDDREYAPRRTNFTLDPSSRFSLLEKMATRRAVVVIRDSDVTEYGNVEFIWGLFTISDLNRHSIRSTIYRLLAEVESGLASCLDRQGPDPWRWLKHLAEDHQVRVLGYWELSKQRGVDVGPIAALTLSQLVQVFSRDEFLATSLGYPSRTQFHKATSRLPELRNRVMHPIRPLILGLSDVSDVLDAVLSLEELRDKTETLLEGV